MQQPKRGHQWGIRRGNPGGACQRSILRAYHERKPTRQSTDEYQDGHIMEVHQERHSNGNTDGAYQEGVPYGHAKEANHGGLSRWAFQYGPLWGIPKGACVWRHNKKAHLDGISRWAFQGTYHIGIPRGISEGAYRARHTKRATHGHTKGRKPNRAYQLGLARGQNLVANHGVDPMGAHLSGFQNGSN